MAKFKLIADPTFVSKVPIPVAGEAPIEIKFTFKHRTKDELEQFAKDRINKSDVETVMEMATGWELDDEFNADNVQMLLQNRIGSGLAAYNVYLSELYKHKQGN